jgi:hypothetical protein
MVTTKTRNEIIPFRFVSFRSVPLHEIVNRNYSAILATLQITS